MNLVNELLAPIDKLLDRSARFYVYLIVIFHLLYVGLFFGLVQLSESFLRRLNIGIQLFICFFLIIRFFPLRNHVLKKYDPVIIFGCATFLLLNLGFIEIVSKTIKNKI